MHSKQNYRTTFLKSFHHNGDDPGEALIVTSILDV